MRLDKDAAQRLRHARARRGWGLRVAAKKAGISVGTWQRAEAGEEVEYSSAVRIAEALGFEGPDAAEQMAGVTPVVSDADEIARLRNENEHLQGVIDALIAAKSTADMIEADPLLDDAARSRVLGVYLIMSGQAT